MRCGGFATVTSTHASPVPAHLAARAEMRRFIATRREQHSENASRLREWTEAIKNERGRVPQMGR